MNIFAFYVQREVLKEEELDEENFLVDDTYYEVPSHRSTAHRTISLPEINKEKTETHNTDADRSVELAPLSTDRALNHDQSAAELQPKSHNKIHPEPLDENL